MSVFQAMVDAGRAERTQMLASFVELISNAGVKLDISHYNCILQVCCQTAQSHENIFINCCRSTTRITTQWMFPSFSAA